MAPRDHRPTPILTALTEPSSPAAHRGPNQLDVPFTAGLISPSRSTLSATTDSPDTPMLDVCDDSKIGPTENERSLNNVAEAQGDDDPSKAGRAAATGAEHKASRKHASTPLNEGAKKRAKLRQVGIAQDATADVDDSGRIQLPFQTIKSIKMPPRTATGPPDPKNLPYGPAVDYKNSMIIFWVDELDHTYAEAAKLYGEKFVHDKAVEEAIRRRHIRALCRLAEMYGVKPLKEIEGPIGTNTMRRGKNRAPRTPKMGKPFVIHRDEDRTADTEDSVASRLPNGNRNEERAPLKAKSANASMITTTGHIPVNKSGTSQPKRGPHPSKYLLHGYKTIEKAAIVVWKDLEGMDFKDIRTKLDDEYGWSLGRATVEKYYYTSRANLYSAINQISIPESEDEEDDSLGEGGSGIAAAGTARVNTEFRRAPSVGIARRRSI